MRPYGTLVAIWVLVIATPWRDSTLANVVRYSALAYLFGDLIQRAWSGYRRRLPHWTPESWRRFFMASAMFVAPLLAFIAMMVALEFRLPIAGAAQSTVRYTWIAVMMICMIAGALGLSSAISWLGEGDASAQFTRFRKRSRA